RRISTADEIQSLNPSNPFEVVAKSASCSPGDVEQAMISAKKAFPAWRDARVEERSEVLFKAAEWFRARRFEIAALEVKEAGKPWADADGDVCEAIDFLEYYG